MMLIIISTKYYTTAMWSFYFQNATRDIIIIIKIINLI